MDYFFYFCSTKKKGTQMAVAKNSIVLHNVKGRIGNIVVKHSKGRTIVSAMPKQYTPSKSIAAVSGRKNFGAAVKLAKSVNSIPALKEIWKLADLEGFNSYLKIISNNSKKVDNGSLTTSNIITPEGLHLLLNSVAVEENKLIINFLSIDAGKLKFPAVIFAVFYFKENEKYLFSLIGVVDEFISGEDCIVTIEMNVLIKNALKKDPNPVIYFALSGSTPIRKKVYWTSTAAINI